jgi:ribonuclease P protein component
MEQTREADIPTVKPRAQAPPWLPCPDGNQGRSRRAGPPSCQGPQAAERLTGPAAPVAAVVSTLATLKVRKDFLHTAQGLKASGQFVLLQARLARVHRPAPFSQPVTAWGVTASKKVGNAVARNRAKRRLRAAMTALLPVHGAPGWDYVAVARTATVSAPWPALLDDLARLFIRLAAKAEGKPARTATATALPEAASPPHID